MVIPRMNSVFAAKLEATVGTAENLTNAEGVFNARDFSIVPGITFERREAQGGYGYIKSVPGVMSGTCTITHDLQYDGTNIPTWASVLLPACGYVNTAGVFAPMSRGPGTTTSVPRTITLGHYFGGKRRRLAGAMGSFVINLPTGQTPTITFTFTGKYFENESDQNLLAPTYPPQDNLRFAGGSLTWASANICTANMSVDAGNVLTLRLCNENTDDTGIRSALVLNRAPIITADPESVLVATANREQQWINGTTGALTATIKGPGNSTLVINAPAAQLENNQPGVRDEIVVDNLTWLATRSAAPDDELTITFNALTP
jgi:hypothetical protein